MKRRLVSLISCCFAVSAALAQTSAIEATNDAHRAEVDSVFEKAESQLGTEGEQMLLDGLDSMEKAIRAARAIQDLKNSAPAADVAAEKALGQQDFTDLSELVDRFERSRTSAKKPTTEDGALMLFVSFSMPADVLREYTRQANAAGATLVLRGNYKGGTVRATTEQAAVLNVGGAGWIINPEIFTGYKIDAVPALVLSLENLDPDAEGCFPIGEYASVFGEISIVGSLEKMAERATRPEIRELAKKRLALLTGN
jgi:type-F conjugative transfer system pilin assembly protein TrbC